MTIKEIECDHVIGAYFNEYSNFFDLVCRYNEDLKEEESYFTAFEYCPNCGDKIKEA